MTAGARKAMLAAALAAALLAIAVVATANLVELGAAAYERPLGGLSRAQAVMILGAKVYSSGAVSLIVRDRIDAALEVYRAGKAGKILVSGDHGTVSYDEVNTIKRELMAAGVPEEDIFMDHAGFSTYESMYRARDVFLVEKLIVVTQKFHMARALFIARSLGLEAKGYAADRRRYAGELQNEAREILARAKDFFAALVFKPLPTYLGDAIPITGDGRATQD